MRSAFVALLLGSCVGPSLPAAPKLRPAAPPEDPAFAYGEPATISVGAEFACAIRRDGGVACWGSNRSGQLGQGDDRARSGAVKVSGLDRVVEVAAGAGHACARRDDGAVYCWGDGAAFRLGSRLDEGAHGPMPVPQVTRAVALAAGPEHTCAILVDGSVRCWGSPEYGRLGLDHLDHVTEPANVALDVERATGLALGDATTCIRDAAGHVHCWGIGHEFDANQRQTIEGVRQVTRIAAGGDTTCALEQGGQARCWTTDGEVHPLEELPDGATQLALGGSVTCAVARGQLTCSGYSMSLDLSSGSDDPPRRYEAIEPVKEARAVDDRVCARSADGAVHCFGSNDHGALGVHPGDRFASPVEVTAPVIAKQLEVSGRNSCAVGADGKIHCWGSESSSRSPIKTVEAIEGAVAVAVGRAHACALSSLGTVSCWGDDAHGQLGREAPKPSPPQPLPRPERRPGLAGMLEEPPPEVPVSKLGFLGSIAGASRLGAVVEVVAGLPRISALAAGDDSSCALGVGGVWCWGNTGRREHRYVPPKRHTIGSRGPCPTPFGGAGQPEACADNRTARRIPDSAGAKAIAASGDRFCLARADGTVACWSDADPEPAAENQPVVSLHAGERLICAIDPGGALHCWPPDESKRRLPRPFLTSFGEPLVDWAGGERFACAATRQGRVLCVGEGDRGQLGNGRFADSKRPTEVVGIGKAVQVGVGDRHACALLSDGKVRCWGEGSAQVGWPGRSLRRSSEPLRIDIE